MAKEPIGNRKYRWGRRKKTSDATLQEAAKLRAAQEEEQKKIAYWVNDYVPTLDTDALLTLHKGRSNALAHEFAKLSFYYHSMVDAAIRSNAAVRAAFKTEDSMDLDIDKIIPLVENIMSLDMCRLLLHHTDLSAEIKKEFYRRHLARILPLQDNIPKPAGAALLPKQAVNSAPVRASRKQDFGPNPVDLINQFFKPKPRAR